MTTIDHRGRDLVIIPNEEMLRLPTPQLLQALFGAHLPADIRAAMGRDKRHAFLRTQPLHFQAVRKRRSLSPSSRTTPPRSIHANYSVSAYWSSTSVTTCPHQPTA